MPPPLIRNIFRSNIIADVDEIILSEETWQHIVANHPMMGFPSFEAAIIACVTSAATTVHQSRTNPRSLVYVDANSTNIHGNPLRVPVKRMESNSGYIATAVFASSESPGVVLWRKPK
jgi:hypothetical protein